MLQFPTWKRVLIWGLVLLGLLLAMPNLFYARVERHNDAAAAIAAGQPITEARAGDLSAWPGWLPSGLVNLGLDLRGGAHLLAEVQIDAVLADRMDALWPEVRDALRDLRGTVGTIRRQESDAPGTLRVRVSSPDNIGAAVSVVQDLAQPIQSLTGAGSSDIEVSAQGEDVVVTLSEAERRATADRTIEQALEIVRRRINETGTREPNIQRQGRDRILIQVPGVGSAAELRELIGTTARLTFHAVEGTTSDGDQPPGPGNVIYPSAEEEGMFYILEERPTVTGEALTDAQPTFNQNGQPAVSFRFNPSGARAFGEFTTNNVGQRFAAVLDQEVISAPVVNEPITGGAGIITGDFTVETSTDLAVLLRAGALPAPLTFLEERTIGPQLGQDSIEAGRLACIVAFVAVLAFMGASYGAFGLIANAALILNVALIFGLLSLIGATLTLPGIAGIVLTIGMAVDANVLIFERIREEIKTARGPARAIERGYERALSAIFDANITTLITAAILFTMGSGPVRGFAVTLGLGILTSVFSAIYVTRLMIVMWMERARPRTVTV